MLREDVALPQCVADAGERRMDAPPLGAALREGRLHGAGGVDEQRDAAAASVEDA